MKHTILKLSNLQIGFDYPLGTPLNLELPAGSTLGIFGDNGSGKSTLVKTLLGLIPSLDGSYQWDQTRSLAYVPQENQIDSLFPLTVIDLLKMGQYPKLPRFLSESTEFQEQAQQVLKEIKMEQDSKRLFRELSGGQKQRVLLGRALMGNPQALLLDEPFNSLDYGYRKIFWNLLKDWQQKRNLTLLIIEHDINRILNQVDYVIILGRQKSLAGMSHELLKEEILSQAFAAPLHLHKEQGEIQIHFL